MIKLLVTTALRALVGTWLVSEVLPTTPWLTLWLSIFVLSLAWRRAYRAQRDAEVEAGQYEENTWAERKAKKRMEDLFVRARTELKEERKRRRALNSSDQRVQELLEVVAEPRTKPEGNQEW